MLDFDQPIGLLMLWLLHFVPTDGNPTGQTETIQLYQNTPDPVHFHSHDEVLLLFAGFELVEPGLAGSAFGRPSGPGDISDNVEMNPVSYGGVGRKP